LLAEASNAAAGEFWQCRARFALKIQGKNWVGREEPRDHGPLRSLMLKRFNEDSNKIFAEIAAQC